MRSSEFGVRNGGGDMNLTLNAESRRAGTGSGMCERWLRRALL